MSTERQAAIEEALLWLRAALDCKNWHWDADQREAAEHAYAAARAASQADVSDTFERAFVALSKAVSDAGYHQNVRGGEIYLTRKDE